MTDLKQALATVELHLRRARTEIKALQTENTSLMVERDALVEWLDSKSLPKPSWLSR